MGALATPVSAHSTVRCAGGSRPPAASGGGTGSRRRSLSPPPAPPLFPPSCPVLTWAGGDTGRRLRALAAQRRLSAHAESSSMPVLWASVAHGPSEEAGAAARWELGSVWLQWHVGGTVHFLEEPLGGAAGSRPFPATGPSAEVSRWHLAPGGQAGRVTGSLCPCLPAPGTSTARLLSSGVGVQDSFSHRAFIHSEFSWDKPAPRPENDCRAPLSVGRRFSGRTTLRVCPGSPTQHCQPRPSVNSCEGR